MARPPRRRDLKARPALRIVLTTLPPRKASAVARALVTAGVAACVQVVPGLASVYRWRGETTAGREALLVLKTTAKGLARCVEALAALHPYEVPEVVVLTPSAVTRAYDAWAVTEVGRRT